MLYFYNSVSILHKYGDFICMYITIIVFQKIYYLDLHIVHRSLTVIEMPCMHIIFFTFLSVPLLQS